MCAKVEDVDLMFITEKINKGLPQKNL